MRCLEAVLQFTVLRAGNDTVGLQRSEVRGERDDMIDKEHAIAAVAEDIGMRVRLSKIRGNLRNAGFSPEEAHEIIAAALELRRDERKKRESTGRDTAIVIVALGLIVTLTTFLLAAPGAVYLIPVGLFSCGAYLWYGKPGS